MTGEKTEYGLIGFPLGHSWSANWFNEKFIREGDLNKSYHLFQLQDISEFPDLIASHPELRGLNVTIPYKEKVLPFLDELDSTAGSIGAVNTILIERTGGKIHTRGFNTDAPGFLQSLSGLHLPGQALILGTGGASKAVAWALARLNIRFACVSRQKRGKDILSYQELTPDIISRYPFIVNTTPAGMYPEVDTCPSIPYHLLTGNHFLYDLVYNPGETLFIKQGKSMNAMTMNGLQMLFNQAELSWKIFLSNG